MSTGAAPFYRVAQDYASLVGVIRERTEQMEISRLELDSLAGLTDGHSGKLLSPAGRKTLGIISLGAILQRLGLIMVIVEDPIARDRTLAERTPFDAANRRIGNRCNPCKSPPRIESNAPPPAAKVETPKPRSNEPVSRAHLHVIQPRTKGARWGGAL